LEPLLTITAVDPDEDYLGIEIFASSARFAGSSLIYAGLDDVGRFADRLAGFPSSPRDERTFGFGARLPGQAGGFARFVFRTVGELGRSEVAVEMMDDELRNSGASSAFTFPVEAAAVDRFVAGLRIVQSARSGVATLSASG
jgi:hypothetical protein